MIETRRTLRLMVTSRLLIGGAVRRSDRFRIVEKRPSRLNGSLNTSHELRHWPMPGSAPQ
jgi:hypothetical protein